MQINVKGSSITEQVKRAQQKTGEVKVEKSKASTRRAAAVASKEEREKAREQERERRRTELRTARRAAKEKTESEGELVSEPEEDVLGFSGLDEPASPDDFPVLEQPETSEVEEVPSEEVEEAGEAEEVSEAEEPLPSLFEERTLTRDSYDYPVEESTDVERESESETTTGAKEMGDTEMVSDPIQEVSEHSGINLSASGSKRRARSVPEDEGEVEEPPAKSKPSVYAKPGKAKVKLSGSASAKKSKKEKSPKRGKVTKQAEVLKEPEDSDILEDYALLDNQKPVIVKGGGDKMSVLFLFGSVAACAVFAGVGFIASELFKPLLQLLGG